MNYVIWKRERDGEHLVEVLGEVDGEERCCWLALASKLEAMGVDDYWEKHKKLAPKFLEGRTDEVITCLRIARDEWMDR